MIKGVIRNGQIVPLDPIPSEWGDERAVTIEPADTHADVERAEIERWFQDLTALGPARYEPGEREMIEQIMSEADRQAKDAMRRSWAPFNGGLSARHEPPGCGTE